MLKLTFALLIAAVCLTGCSKKSELFETVPAKSQFILCVDFTQLNKDLTEGNENSETAKLAKPLIDFGDALDLKNVVMVPVPRGLMFSVAIKNPGDVEKMFADNQTKEEKEEGFTVHLMKGNSYIVNGPVLHMCSLPADDAAKAVRDMLKDAAEKSIAEATGVVDALTGKTPYNVAISNLPDNWGVMKGEIKGPAFVGECNVITADGKPVKYEGLTKVNPTLLQYAPSNSMAVLVTGFNEKMDWDKVFGAINEQMAGEPMAAAQVQMLEPYLRAVDGSMMITVAPKGEELSAPVGIDSFKVLAMVHMKQEMVNKSVEGLKQMFGGVGGLGVAELENGLYGIDLNGTILYFGNVDGYLTIANYEPTNNNSSTLAGEFADTFGGMTVIVPSLAVVNPQADYGIEMRVTGGQERANIVFKLTGTDKPLLPTILNSL